MANTVTFELMNTSLGGIQKEYRVITAKPLLSVHTQLMTTRRPIAIKLRSLLGETKAFKHAEVLEVEYVKGIEGIDELTYDIGYFRNDPTL